MIGRYDKVFIKEGTDAGRSWKRFAVCINGKWASTFDKRIGETLILLKGKKVEIETETNDNGYINILQVINPEKQPNLFDMKVIDK